MVVIFLFLEKKQLTYEMGAVSFSHIFKFYASCDHIDSRYPFMALCITVYFM